MDCIIPASLLLPTWTQILGWLWFLMKLDLVLIGLLASSRLVGKIVDRYAPDFGEYRSNVVDLQERREQLNATAYRRAR